MAMSSTTFCSAGLRCLRRQNSGSAISEVNGFMRERPRRLFGNRFALHRQEDLLHFGRGWPGHDFELTELDGVFHGGVPVSELFGGEREGDGFLFAGGERDA